MKGALQNGNPDEQRGRPETEDHFRFREKMKEVFTHGTGRKLMRPMGKAFDTERMKDSQPKENGTQDFNWLRSHLTQFVLQPVIQSISGNGSSIIMRSPKSTNDSEMRRESLRFIFSPPSEHPKWRRFGFIRARVFDERTATPTPVKSELTLIGGVHC